MQIVVGLLKRDAGEVERPARLGYCPQIPMVWEKLTVGEHFQLFGRAYGLDEEAADRAEEALAGCRSVCSLFDGPLSQSRVNRMDRARTGYPQRR